jgi:hypothetical protein
MALREGSLCGRRGGVEDVGKVGERTGMHTGILVRVLIGIRMLDHAPEGLGLEDDPCALAFFEVISNLHALALRSAVLRPEFDFGVGLFAGDRDGAHIRVHGTHVKRCEMVRDTRVDGLPVALLLASANLLQRTENSVEEIRGLMLKFVPKAGKAIHECAAALVAERLSIPRRSLVTLLVFDSINPLITAITVEGGLHFGSF